jgi:hypothetical protein
MIKNNNFFLAIAFVFLTRITLITADDQPMPRRITDTENKQLFALIKANEHAKIVKFFKDNDNIDFAMIRNAQEDNTSDDNTFNFTPLAAALRFCAKETAMVLTEPQFKTPWTVKDAPLGYSLLELAAKYCPSLAHEIIGNSKSHLMKEILSDPQPAQLVQVYKSLLIQDQIITSKERKTFLNWIVDLFANVHVNYSEFIDAWISSNDHLSGLAEFLRNDIEKVNSEFFIIACEKLMRAGKLAEFAEAINNRSGKSAFASTLSLYIRVIDRLKTVYWNPRVKTALSEHVAKQNIQAEFEALTLATNFFPDRKINYRRIYGYFYQRFPRIDTAIALAKNDHDPSFLGFPIVWTGDMVPITKSIETDILKAYESDDSEQLKNIFTRENVWSQVKPMDLRFEVQPFHLSPLKMAVMLKKETIVKYLISRPEMSLFATTEAQLSALQMAACYSPELLVNQLAQELKVDCKTRLRALNHLIAMFGETNFQKCPSGGENAPAVLASLMDTDGIKCIDTEKTDAVAAAIANNWPIDLVKGFHGTGAYKATENYIDLSLKQGSLDLFKYFTKDAVKDSPSPAHMKALVTWLRYTDGELTNQNVEMLEYLLNDRNVMLNIRDGLSGASALSLATQKSLTWVVNRLVFEKSLNINSIDKGTGSNPLQHSIQLFRNNVPNTSHKAQSFMDNLNYIIKSIIFSALERSMGIDRRFKGQAEAAYAAMSGKATGTFDIGDHMIDSIDKVLKDFETQAANNGIPADIIDLWKNLRIVETLKELKGKPFADGLVHALRMTIQLEKIRSKLEGYLMIVAHTISEEMQFKINQYNPLLKMFLELARMILSDADMQYQQLLKTTSSTLLIHNILLAHPFIDPTIENKAGLDSLHLIKNRAARISGDPQGEDELIRTHVRIRTLDAIHDPKKNPKRIVFGIVSTVIIGSVSYGMLRWIL